MGFNEITSSFKARLLKFGEASSSEDLTKMSKELASDFYNIYSKLAEDERLLYKTISSLQLENKMLDLKLQNLNSSLKNLSEADILILPLFDSEKINFGDESTYGVEPIDKRERANFSADTGSATPYQYRSIAKTYFEGIESDSKLLSKYLQVEIEEDKEDYGATEVIDSGLYEAFLPDSREAFMRNVIVDNNQSFEINSITATINIKMPKEAIGNTYANTLFLDPFPNGFVDIKDIKVLESGVGDFVSLKETGEFKEIKSASNQMITFRRRPLEAVKIILEQPNKFSSTNENLRAFSLGANSISIHDIKYGDKGSFYIEFSTINPVGEISNISPIFSIDQSGEINYEIYGINTNDNSLVQMENNEPIPYTHNTDFILKIEILNHKEQAPVLKGLEINYDSLS